MGQALFVWVIFRILGQLLGNGQVTENDLACFEISSQVFQLLVNPGDPFVGIEIAKDVVENLPASVGRQLAPISPDNVQTFEFLSANWARGSDL